MIFLFCFINYILLDNFMSIIYNINGKWATSHWCDWHLKSEMNAVEWQKSDGTESWRATEKLEMNAVEW